MEPMYVRHFWQIAKCPVAEQVRTTPLALLTGPDGLAALRCAPVISSQFLAAHKRHSEGDLPWLLPEPWNGRLESAPLLFVGQNPAASHDERYPNEEWVREDVEDFFVNRFGLTNLSSPINEEFKVRLHDTRAGVSYAQKATPYLKAVHTHARGIFGKEPSPGVHYALTEAVRCKSTKVPGPALEQAVQTCVLHLKRTLELSGARVVVGLGGLANEALRLVTGIEDPKTHPLWNGKALYYWSHPARRGGSEQIPKKDAAKLRKSLAAG